MSGDRLTFSRSVRATPAALFRAWTRAGGLREWLCDGATVEARVGGRYVLWWHSGYLTAGAIEAIEPERRIVYGWSGAGDPGPTRVAVALAPDSGSVRVTVEHSAIKAGGAWRAFRDEVAHGWETGLENLQSALETGEDLRVLRRPMLGIDVGDYNGEIAARLGIAGVDGVRLNGTTRGMAAEVAGMRKDDVMTSLGGRTVSGWVSLTDALQRHRAAEAVTVTFYRDGVQRELELVLSARTLADVPQPAAALAQRLRLLYEDAFASVSEPFAGASLHAARAHPEAGGWSALETVAHLIDSERDLQSALIDAINDDERIGDAFSNPTNVEAHLSALASIHTRSSTMLAALRAAYEETVALVERLPESVQQRKATYRRLARNLLETAEHTDEHVAQIQEALATGGGVREAALRPGWAGRRQDMGQDAAGDDRPRMGHGRMRILGGL